jgi:hypothetical protein
MNIEMSFDHRIPRQAQPDRQEPQTLCSKARTSMATRREIFPLSSVFLRQERFSQRGVVRANRPHARVAMFLRLAVHGCQPLHNLFGIPRAVVLEETFRHLKSLECRRRFGDPDRLAGAELDLDVKVVSAAKMIRGKDLQARQAAPNDRHAEMQRRN